jgi:hypothetical protein
LRSMRVASVVLLGCVTAACAVRPAPPPSGAPSPRPVVTPAPAASPGIEEGASVEAAVLVPPMTEREGIEWENRWIYGHYGRFRKKTVALASREGRRYDVITVELADHSEKVLYFDITDFFGK